MVRRGIGWLELLVICGLILLGAVALLPRWQRESERARLATCASNIKSIGLAVAMYTEDYGRLPLCDFTADRGGAHPVPDHLRERWRLPAGSRFLLTDALGPVLPGPYNWGEFTCVTVRRAAEPVAWEGGHPVKADTGGSYWWACGGHGRPGTAAYRGTASPLAALLYLLAPGADDDPHRGVLLGGQGDADPDDFFACGQAMGTFGHAGRIVMAGCDSLGPHEGRPDPLPGFVPDFHHPEAELPLGGTMILYADIHCGYWRGDFWQLAELLLRPVSAPLSSLPQLPPGQYHTELGERAAFP